MTKRLNAVFLFLAVAMFASAAPITFSSVTGGGATTGTAPFDLTSTDISYSLLTFDPNQTFTFGDITNLDLNYKVVLGGIGGGAPRIEVGFTDSTSLLVLLGPPGTFTNPALGVGNSGNLVAMNDVGRYDLSQGGLGGSGYTDYSAAIAAAGGKTVDHFQVILDSFGGNNKEFLVGKDSLHVDANVAAVPEPMTLSMVGLGLLGLGLIGRCRKVDKRS